jgi:hypothetical protein
MLAGCGESRVVRYRKPPLVRAAAIVPVRSVRSETGDPRWVARQASQARGVEITHVAVPASRSYGHPVTTEAQQVARRGERGQCNESDTQIPNSDLLCELT